MKRYLLFGCAGLALLLAVPAAERAEISTKTRDFPEKRASIKRTYRRDHCIMLEMTQDGKRTRAFRINGKTVLAESDDDKDGFFESFMVFDPATGDFEWFTRTTNDVVRPVDSEKLNEAKAKKASADKALSELLEREH